MTTSSPDAPLSGLAALYAGTAKLILTAPLQEAAALLPPETGLFVASADTDGIAVTGSDGQTALTAPTAGITVIAAPPDGASLADRLLALWAAPGLDPPPLVQITGADGDSALAVARAFAQAAGAAYGTICREALDLDLRIAALRDRLEDARNKWQDCSDALIAVSGDLPVLGYHTEEMTGSLALAPGRVALQRLPFAGPFSKAAGIHIDRAARGGTGRLTCRLLAAEDDAELDHWTLDARRTGWCVIDLPAEIPWRYRGLCLALDWDGPAEDAPALSTARAAGMERYLLHLDGLPQAGRRLAMRAWTGPPTARGSVLEQGVLHRGAAGNGPYAITLGRPALEAHDELVSRSLGQWPWVNVDDGAIMVHPTTAGPSIVALTLDTPDPVTKVTLLAASPNRDAPRIEFLAAAFPGDLALDLDSSAADPLPYASALDHDGWQALEPGSSRSLELTLRPAPGPVRLVLATRVTGASIAHAHGWFRNIRAICSP